MDATIKLAVTESGSRAETLRKLGRACVGTNYRWLQRQVERLGLNTSHWKAHGTTKSAQRLTSTEVLMPGSSFSTGRAKKVVLREQKLPYKCAVCGLPPVWNGQPLVLRLDHVNGVRNDHRQENLRFLCPNCDSQTSTFCGRNKARKPRVCPACGRTSKGGLCRSCAHLGQPTRVIWPPVEELQKRLLESSYLEVARELGVSDNAIRKHLRVRAQCQIPQPSKTLLTSIED